MFGFSRARQRMVETQLVARGISDERVLEAMASVPRENFVSAAMAGQAYNDSPLPIGEKQTISQPYIVALMTEALRLRGNERVLEIGTGSGYQAAILSRLASRVYTVERHAPLSRKAREVLEAIGCKNVVTRNGDGTLGWREFSPFDAIMVTAYGPEIPQVLVDQLEVGGRLVMPIGSERSQQLCRIEKQKEGIDKVILCDVRFVPLVGHFGWEKTTVA